MEDKKKTGTKKSKKKRKLNYKRFQKLVGILRLVGD